MSEWIRFSDKKPDTMIEALVFNERGWMRGVRATYHPSYNVWILYNPQSPDKFTLDVTHYFELPEYPPVT